MIKVEVILFVSKKREIMGSAKENIEFYATASHLRPRTTRTITGFLVISLIGLTWIRAVACCGWPTILCYGVDRERFTCLGIIVIHFALLLRFMSAAIQLRRLTMENGGPRGDAAPVAAEEIPPVPPAVPAPVFVAHRATLRQSRTKLGVTAVPEA